MRTDHHRTPRQHTGGDDEPRSSRQGQHSDDLNTTLATLGFPRTDDVGDPRSLAALTSARRRSGISVLHLPGHTYNIGQSTDVVRRLAPHGRTYTAIQRLSFTPLPPDRRTLDAHEQEAIVTFERLGYPLLTIMRMSIPYRSSAVDLIVTPEEQRATQPTSLQGSIRWRSRSTMPRRFSWSDPKEPDQEGWMLLQPDVNCFRKEHSDAKKILHPRVQAFRGPCGRVR